MNDLQMKFIHKTRLLIVKKNTILVLENVGEPKRLTLAGGVVKKKESLEESLIRETMEEIGLKINLTNLIFLNSNSKTIDNKIIIKHFYLYATEESNFSIPEKEKEKFKDVYWIKWKDAIRYMDKLDKKAVKDYFSKKIKKKN
jgi:8-oxo-dGTP diphosphatase